jgi:uncharacterized membrane protein
MNKHRYTNEEIASWRKEHRSIFYFNTEDTNFIVPKQYGFGVTFNWAHPLSWLVGAAVLALIIYSLVT